MVGPFQVTFIFDLPGHGFTETHWRQGPEEETLEQFFTIAQELGRRRQAMSGAETILQGIRISNAELDGRVGTTQIKATPGTPGKGSAASNVAFNVLCADLNNNHTKTTQMRGCWDDEELTGGALLRSSAFMTAFNSWASYYTAQDFGWYGVNAVTADLPITGYTVTSAGVVTLQVAGDLTGLLAINKPRRVRISGLNGGRSQLNGEQVVIFTGLSVPAPNPISSVLLKFPFGLTAFTAIGFLKVQTYIFRNAVATSLQRIGNRQAGAPLLRSRGRSPKRTRV